MTNSTAINLRADRYCVAQTMDTCRHCGQATRVVAVVLPAGHEVLDWDDDDADDLGTWQPAAQPAFLFHVAYLPGHVQRRMCAQSAYAIERSVPGNESCWANHCEHCGAYVDDQELFCEPGGGFCPASEAQASLIDLEVVDEPIGVDAAGYAPQPEFFDAMNGADAMNRI